MQVLWRVASLSLWTSELRICRQRPDGALNVTLIHVLGGVIDDFDRSAIYQVSNKQHSQPGFELHPGAMM